MTLIEFALGVVALIVGVWLLAVVIDMIRGLGSALRTFPSSGSITLERIADEFKPIARIVKWLSAVRFLSLDSVVVSAVLAAAVIAIDPVRLVDVVDRASHPYSPLLGWAVLGLAVGAGLSFSARAKGLGFAVALAFGGRTPRAARHRAIATRVRDAANLRAAETAAQRMAGTKRLVGSCAIVLVAAAVSASAWKNSGPAGNERTDSAATTLQQAAQNADVAAVNRVLNAAVRSLADGTDLARALATLRSIESLSSQAPTPALTRASRAASHYLGWYRSETERMVRNSLPEAASRSEAYRQIDLGVALSWLGQLHESGQVGTSRDWTAAFALYKEAAVNGSEESALRLEALARRMTTEGKEAERMPALAHFKHKASLGDVWAQYWLGEWYRHGPGKSGRMDEAVEWYLRALDQQRDPAPRIAAFVALAQVGRGNPKVVPRLDVLAPRFVTSNETSVRAAAYAYLESRAAEGDGPSQLLIGLRYRDGDGVAKDLGKAREWLHRASRQATHRTVSEQASAALAALADR